MPRTIRRYERWPGKNYFFCDGRIIVGSQPTRIVLTLLMHIVIILIYIFLTGNGLPIANRLCAFIIFLFTLYYLLRAIFTEPGIVARYEGSEQPIKPPSSVIGQHRMLCPKCNFYRPHRCKHCKFCDNCVEEFDHHCPWIGGCIGRRNYHFFVAYLIWESLLSGYIFFFSCLYISDAIGDANYSYTTRVMEGKQVIMRYTTNGESILDTSVQIVRKNIVTCILIAITGIAFFSIFSLTMYHMYVIYNGQTTNEMIRGTFKDEYNNKIHNPYTRGGCANFYRVFCERKPPSKLNLREFIDVPDDEDILSNGQSSQIQNHSYQQEDAQGFAFLSRGRGKRFGRHIIIRRRANEYKENIELKPRQHGMYIDHGARIYEGKKIPSYLGNERCLAPPSESIALGSDTENS